MASRKTIDPFMALEADHKRVASLFKRIEALSDRAESERARLFIELRTELFQHMALEESVLYPMLKEIKAFRDVTMEAYEEHHVGKTLLMELDASMLDLEVWNAKMMVLKENIEHHVKEEEVEMFPKARKSLKEPQKSALLDAMEAFRARNELIPA